MKKSLIYLFNLAMIISLIGCEKSGNLDMGTNINKIRVYDDSLATSNYPSKIIAGNGRLYMTYGQVLPENFGFGFIGSFPATDFTTILMATDNEGNPLWKTTIPYSEGDISGLKELNK